MTSYRLCIARGHDCADGGRALPHSSRCRNHERGGWAAYKRRHPERAAFYASSTWQDTRKRHLKANPNCAVCGQKATHVDHIVPVAEGGALDGPLQSLCAKHHRRKTLDESHRGMKRAASRKER